jgi:UDP-N-acetylglucosamine--N-acetylmuramyl-(pentapeptide) pyrophosphoryl-undecaprenol N-acetylglucosamine transferase
MTKPIVITGGGTGGHVFPMLAIAEQLRLLGVSPSRLRYVGSRRGQEATLLAGDPVALTLLPGRGLRRSFARADLGSNVVAITELVGAISAALFKTGKWRPAVVVSVGGYASFAASLAAIAAARSDRDHGPIRRPSPCGSPRPVATHRRRSPRGGGHDGITGFTSCE